MVYNFYFSPAGGTAKVADIIGSALNAKKTIDFTPASVAPAAISLQAADDARNAIHARLATVCAKPKLNKQYI